jgi:hypothetical protein
MTRQNDIPDNSRTSAVTTDMPAEQDIGEVEHVEKDRLVASGLGLIKVDGIDKRYVGLPPALDGFNPTAPGEQTLSSQNTTFLALWQVPFHPSIEIKDPTTGEFYFPAEDAQSWTDCELNGAQLVPPLPPPAPPPAADEEGRKKKNDDAADDDGKLKQSATKEEEAARKAKEEEAKDKLKK